MSEFVSKLIDVLQLGERWVMLSALVAVALLVWSIINRTRWALRWRTAGSANIDIPERRWTYDAQDLEDFARAAEGAHMLQFYVSILRGSDLGFAVATAAIAAYIWGRLAVTDMNFAVINWAALPLGAMAVLYGIADVAENLKLSSILKHPEAIDQAEAAATNALTRIKRVTIILSIFGVIVFFVCAIAPALASRGSGPHRATA
jgi:hypothetical protein